MIPVALLVLALLGLAIAVYFTLLYYRVIPPDSSQLPRVCRAGENVCGAVVFTRYARVFAIPNSILGIVYYLLLLLVALTKLITGHYRYLDAALAASLVAVALAPYLIYALIVRLKSPCPL